MDLYLNGSYEGVYQIADHIRVAADLVNVPEGDYELEAWHEAFGRQTQKLKVEAAIGEGQPQRKPDPPAAPDDDDVSAEVLDAAR